MRLLTRQTYIERRPVPALDDVISTVWIQRVLTGTQPYEQRNIPTGCVEIVCKIGGIPRIVGPLTAPVIDPLSAGTTVVGARFRPGTATTLLGMPASELVDTSVSAAELWATAFMELGERLAESSSPEMALAALQHGIASRLSDAPARDPLVAEAVRRLGPWQARDVKAVRRSLHVSERHFRRRVQTAVGISPKALHRMLRFQGFLALVQLALSRADDPAADRMASLAAAAGYADESHLRRECRRLTGLTPRVFLDRAARECACGHDHTASFAPLLRSNGAGADLYGRGGLRHEA